MSGAAIKRGIAREGLSIIAAAITPLSPALAPMRKEDGFINENIALAKKPENKKSEMVSSHDRDCSNRKIKSNKGSRLPNKWYAPT